MPLRSSYKSCPHKDAEEGSPNIRCWADRAGMREPGSEKASGSSAEAGFNLAAG